MGKIRFRHRISMSIIAMSIIAILVAVSSTAASASSKSVATAAKGSGPTVDIWTAAPINTAGASAPQASSGVRAAIRYINTHGGLGTRHQKVDVKVCNTELTPAGEVQCAQQAASDKKAVAIVAPIIVLDVADFTAAAQKAGLPVIDPSASAAPAVTDRINYPMAPEYLDAAGCAVLMAKQLHVKNIGFATTAIPGSEAIASLGIGAAKKAGLKSAGATVAFPVTATDLTPYVSQMKAENPQAVSLTGSPQDVGSWIAAAASLGWSVPTCVGDRLIPSQLLAGAGAAASNFYVAASYPDPSWSGYPLLTQFRQQARAELAAGDATASLAANNNSEDVLVGWLATQALLQASQNTTGTITKASLLKAMNHTTATFGIGKGALLPPIDFGKPNPDKEFPRLFNTTMFLKEWSVSKKAFVLISKAGTVNGSIIP
jgi:ABC-type branched-subunit amino acid transport system substrate-binding protein